MKAEDFAAWLSGDFGMREGQRREALAALEKAIAVGAEGGVFLRRKAASAAARRTRSDRAMRTSASRLRAVPIARAARLSAGAGEMA